ncbi:hypothetical protein TNCT_176771 [Trichonephila clavata]|uniref:Uncharacterized protein n=1 Tax=Trichonephila clavata TaxID=2740835 RepID=A0A8X6HVZ5_TRICU|nr:hypothetical protein TNCT_176771 [Trichonephila clavata]
MVTGFREIDMLMTKAKSLMVFMKNFQSLAKDRQFTTSYISEHNYLTLESEINNLIDLCEKTDSLICETLNHYEKAVNGIAETVLAQTDMYSFTDSDE